MAPFCQPSYKTAVKAFLSCCFISYCITTLLKVHLGWCWCCHLPYIRIWHFGPFNVDWAFSTSLVLLKHPDLLTENLSVLSLFHVRTAIAKVPRLHFLQALFLIFIHSVPSCPLQSLYWNSLLWLVCVYLFTCLELLCKGNYLQLTLLPAPCLLSSD